MLRQTPCEARANYRPLLFLLFAELRGFLKSFLRGLMGFGGMFHRLSGEFVSGQVVFFAVVRGGGPVRVGRKVVKLGGSLVRIIWHRCLSNYPCDRSSLHACCPSAEDWLFAEDFGVGAGGDEADEAMAVEEEINFEVFGFYAQFIELGATHVLLSERFDGDGSGGHFLRYEN